LELYQEKIQLEETLIRESAQRKQAPGLTRQFTAGPPVTLAGNPLQEAVISPSRRKEESAGGEEEE